MSRLHGWKEIAAYLGRSVRTVQRWEHESGLPMHRSGREGEVIWADTAELDAWLKAAPSDVDANPQATSPEPTKAAAHRLVRLPALAAAGLVVLILVSWALMPRRATAPVNPVGLRTSLGTLEALSSTGQVLWSRHFSGNVPGASDGRPMNVPGAQLLLEDIDGDMRNDVIVAISDPANGTENGLCVLASDGTELFPKIRPEGSVTFGSNVWAGPWTPHRIWVLRDDQGRPTIYASFIHLNQFPTLLLALDAQGREHGRYWSNGYIRDVGQASFRGKPVLLIGATNNDTRGASLAILPRGELRGAPPAVNDEYRCHSCGPETPLEFLIFPRRCIARALDGQSEVAKARVDDVGQLFVYVREGDEPSEEPAVWYTLTPNFDVHDALIGSGVLQVHRARHAAGLLDHPFGPGDEADVFPILRWTASGFVELPPGPVVR